MNKNGEKNKNNKNKINVKHSIFFLFYIPSDHQSQDSCWTLQNMQIKHWLMELCIRTKKKALQLNEVNWGKQIFEIYWYF